MSGCDTSAGWVKWLRPAKQPLSDLDWTENVQQVLTDPTTQAVDPLVSLELTAKPSGTGELTISRLSVDTTGFLTTWWMEGGVPGRVYYFSLTGVTAAARTYQWTFGIKCDPAFAAWPLVSAPSSDFGAPITWAAAA